MKLKRMLTIFLSIIFVLNSTFLVTNTTSSNVINHTNVVISNTVPSDDLEFYALIVGVEKFSGVEFPEEDKIDDGAIAMYNLLVNSSNWKEDNIKILLNENGSKDKIQDAIVNWLGEKEDKNDIVLIFYASHGWKIPITKRKYGHAMVYTYNMTKEFRIEDAITDKEFDSWVDTLDSENIVIILETCYSGKMFALRQKGRVLLTAGGKYFFCGVDEDDTLGCGIFAHFLLQGFIGVADLNNDGWVTAEEVFHYARIPTIHFSIWKQFPFIIEWNNKTIIWFFQIPWMYDRHIGSIPLVQYKIDEI